MQVDAPISQATTSSETVVPDGRAALVKEWCERIRSAKKKFKGDFDRMKENMEFVAGYQWDGQQQMNDDRYTVNLTLRAVNQKAATLYARNPKMVVEPRKKRNFQIWDRKMETLMAALMESQMLRMSGGEPPLGALALLTDFQQGTTYETMVRAVCETLEMAYQYQMDIQTPEFKTQAKQWVRRTCVCGVGYVSVSFCREQEYENKLTSTHTRTNVADQVARARNILNSIKEGEVDAESAEVETLKSLFATIGVSEQSTGGDVSEHLIFDFPPSTSVIVDPCCRSLKGFIGAHWICREFVLPLDFVKGFYERPDMKVGGELLTFNENGEEIDTTASNSEDHRHSVRVWVVRSLDTKEDFTLVDGYKDFVDSPKPVDPVRGFWNVFSLTFNDVETEGKCKATIYPPSDVDLLKSAQKEWNRSRQELRKQRIANAPKYVGPDGVLTEEDIMKLASATANQFIPLKGLAAGQDPQTVLRPLVHAPIDPALYTSDHLSQDMLLSSGLQEANIGPAQPNVTATVGTIAEQSRMTVASSNVDDLDDALTALAACGGEMLLREMSKQTVERIVGVGAVWPDDPVLRADFLNEVSMQIQAASSGRPNRALEIANFERLAPMLLQAGANPQAVIKEAIKRLDDRIDPIEFFPIGGMVPQQAPSGGAPTGSAQTGPVSGTTGPVGPSGRQLPDKAPKPPELPTGDAVPLVGAK